MASEPNINAQAAFLTAVKLRSLDTAVEVLKGIHDSKEAVRRAARTVDDDSANGGGRPFRVSPLLPQIEDLRRAGDLFFDVAKLHIETVDALLGMRRRHTARLEERLGDLLGFPVRGNRGEVLEMVVPVRAVEADHRERPEDGDRTAYCEVVRQFRVRNKTSEALVTGDADAVAQVKLRWSPDPDVDEQPVHVEVRREPGRVAVDEVLPLRLRVFWKAGSLGVVNPLNARAEATGDFILRNSKGDLVKVIQVILRLDPGA